MKHILALFTISIAMSAIADIDTSEWAVNPKDYGMSYEDYLKAELLDNSATMAKRVPFNTLYHMPGISAYGDNWVVSPNNDTIYSLAYWDNTDGLSFYIPDSGDRYVTLQLITERHEILNFTKPGKYSFKKGEIYGDVIYGGYRVGVDASDPKDVAYVIDVIQPQLNISGSDNLKELPKYNRDLLLKVRAKLITEYDKLDNTFGVAKPNFNDVPNHEKLAYVAAGAWGLAVDEVSMYIGYALEGAVGGTCYSATYNVPVVRYFWSITVYDENKHLMSDSNTIINGGTKVGGGNVVLNKDESFTVVYGDESCSDLAPNYLNTPMDKWSFLMRLYGPDVKAAKKYVVPQIKKAK